MGNKVVRALGVKKMEGPAAYFLRLLAIVFVIVLLMSFLLMFCEIGFAMGAGFFGFWITKVPALFVVAYITAAIVFGGNLIADLLYGVVDPKIRRGAAKT